MSRVKVFLPKEISYPMLKLKHSKKKGFSVDMTPLVQLCVINKLPPNGLFTHPENTMSIVVAIYEQYKLEGGEECPVGELFKQKFLENGPESVIGSLLA